MDPSVMGGSTLDAYEEVFISLVSPLYLPCICPISPQYLPCVSPLYLACTSLDSYEEVMDGFLSSSALARVKPAMASAMAPAEFGAITRSSIEEDEAPLTQPQPYPYT